jgi:hypothetical protein
MNLRRHHTRRIIRHSLLLLLVLCLLPMVSLPALAESKTITNLFGGTLMDTYDSIFSAARAGDTLYFITQKALYSFGPGDQAAVKRADFSKRMWNYGVEDPSVRREPQISILLSDGQTLYALDNEAQTLYIIEIQGEQVQFKNPLKLPMDEFVDGEPPYVYVESPEWARILDGRLYLKKQNYEDHPADLFSYDLTTGEKKEHQVNHLVAVDAYKDGKFIAAVYDINNSYDPETGTIRKPELAVFDPADDSLMALDAFLPIGGDFTDSVGSIYYDPAEDCLYTYTDTDLYRLEEGFKTKRLIGYLPMFGAYGNIKNGGLLPLPDGRLAVTFGVSAFIRERTERGLEGVTVLSFAGGMDNPEMLIRVLMDMDNVVLRRVEGLQYNYLSPEQLASMFLTKSFEVDILPINAYAFDLDKLIEKGYLADLSGSQLISNYVGRIQPNLSKAVLKDGKVYAVPVGLLVFPMSAYIKPFEELNLEMPATIKELLVLTRKWAEGFGEENPEYTLISNEYDIRKALTRLVMDSYINTAFGAGEDLVFDTPLFRELMGEIETIPYGDMSQEIDWNTPEGQAAGEEFFQKKGLIETGMGYEPCYSVGMNNSGEHQFKPLILPLDHGMSAFHQADLTMLSVLSNSKNQAAAIELIERYLSKLDLLDLAAMDTSVTEAIPNKDYEKILADLARQITHMEQIIDKAEGAAKSNLEENLKYSKEYYEQFKQTGQYLATAEDLVQMHEVVSKLYVMNGLMNAQRQALWSEPDLSEQYIDGAITLDQFIKQADDKLRLVRMEYQ